MCVHKLVRYTIAHPCPFQDGVGGILVDDICGHTASHLFRSRY